MVRTFCWAAASWQSNRTGKIARKNKHFMRDSSTSGSSCCLYHLLAVRLSGKSGIRVTADESIQPWQCRIR
jgi:hypothetical protein